jgi:DNA mismatch repair protein MSH6
LAVTSVTFKSKTILDLLRSAPDLSPIIKNIQAMYRKPDAGKTHFLQDSRPTNPSVLVEGGDELVPVDGKDEIYDNIMTKIDKLERELAQQLKKFEKSLG